MTTKNAARRIPVERCRLTGEGLHQDHGHAGSAQIEVSADPGEIMLMASDTILGTVGICLHPEDAQHLVERLRVNIDLALSLEAEAAEPATSRLNADGDRMPIRDPQADRSAV